MFAPRPTAIRTRAPSTRVAWPSCSSSTVTPSRPTRTPWTFTPVRTSIFRFAKLRARSFEISSSSIGKSRGRASTIVTWTPYAAKTSANSTPTAPAPITTTEGGRRSSRSASSELMTRVLSIGTPGRLFGAAPVASTIARASSVRTLPSGACTVTAPGAVTVPRPVTRVILFFRNRNSTPLDIRSATWRLRV